VTLGTGGVAESVERGDALLRVLGEASRVDGARVGVGGILGISGAEPEVAELIQDFCGAMRIARGDGGLQGRLELGDARLVLS
jgi:hypothetical protein